MTDTKPESVLSQQRLAANIILITAILMSVLAIVTVFFIPNEDKTVIDNFMIPAIALGAGYGYLLARRGHYKRGIYILLGLIAIASILYPLAANNVGWQAAIGMLLIATAIANGTLPESRAYQISAGAFVLALIVIMVEIFAPGITNIPTTPSSIVVTIILALIYLGLILYRFRQYTLQTKLIIAFIFLSVFSVSVAAFTINRVISSELTNDISQQLTNVADSSATSVYNTLIEQVDLIQTLALDATIKTSLQSREPISDLTRLQALDQQWRRAFDSSNTSDALTRLVLLNSSSSTLTRFITQFPVHAEVFITDIYGANVAATNLTSDYYQADEEWWQRAYNNGQGAIYISQPLFDESSQALSIQLAVPISTEDGEIIGILRSTVNIEVFKNILLLGKAGDTGRTEIYLPDGREIEVHEESGKYELEIEEASQDFIATLQQNNKYIDTVHEGESVLVGQAFIASNQENSPTLPAIQNLNWRVVTIQNREEALQTISNASRTSQIVGVAALAIASLLAVAVTQFLTRPIVRLTQTAEEISKGNYEAHVQAESTDEIGALANSFNRMTTQIRENLVSLERRVAERTTDLELARHQSERRANQLVAVGEISKLINSEQNLEILFSLITRLVSERFGIYHTGIFLIEETKQFAVLQASNSLGGQMMLKRGHQLKVGEGSIVGYVAKSGTPRIALDVGLDAVFFNNPDLPNTRSEMALPLRLRDITIGVLDVQSEYPGAFSEDDANILSILADQIAIAIDNARLFSQTQQTLAEVQALYRQNLQEGWKSFTQEEGMVGYIQNLTGGKALTETIGSAEIQQVINRGDTMVVPANNDIGESTIITPIKLRNQVIGVMRIQAPSADKQWTSNEINLTQAVSERLSLALENARLIQESQNQVIKEQTISEITSRIGSSINLENVLQTAIEELGRSIPGSEVIIKLKEDS